LIGKSHLLLLGKVPVEVYYECVAFDEFVYLSYL
jgi:hypothetical protein